MDLHDQARHRGCPGYAAEDLFPSTLLAVCAPAIASGFRSPRDLQHATLIRVSHMSDNWPFWFEAAGFSAPIAPAGEVIFESNALAMQAALDGVGVAVAELPYVADAFTAGRLVAPFPIVARKQESWLFEYRPSRGEDWALQAFRGWLHMEAERERSFEAELTKQATAPAG